MRVSLRQGVQVITAPQLFATAVRLADRVVELARINRGDRILEPSAGTGRLLDALSRSGIDSDIVGVKLNLGLCDRLRGMELGGIDLMQGDFLQLADTLGSFDRVVMNPPFQNGADIVHILRARTLLNPHGVLVAICAAGPRQHEQLRPVVEDCGGTWELLPADAFREAGTSVRTVLLTMHA